MAWLCLILAGLFEVGWPVGLKLGYTDEGMRAWPLAGAVISMIGSSVFLLIAQRSIPLGTAYAVWTGLGVVGAFVVGLVVFREPVTAGQFACVALIGAGIVGLKVLGA